MQIVIDIPKRTYEQLKFLREQGFDGFETIIDKAVANGKPLPKGHGRIGDLDALREEVSSWGMNDYEPSDFIDEIDMADVIIEADKERER